MCGRLAGCVDVNGLHRMNSTIPVRSGPASPPPKIAVSSATAAAMFEISETLFFKHVALGELPRPRKIGGRSVWLVNELQEAARALPVSDNRPKPRRE
jgi:predicted DNA-binding transcriptional regulator AlpA